MNDRVLPIIEMKGREAHYFAHIPNVPPSLYLTIHRLRYFLTNCGFRLPGEAQQVDRIISTFARCYWEDNAGDSELCPFQDQDTVFLLSFAIIMLNTDLHKSAEQSLRRKRQHRRMTKAEFLNNLKGVCQSDPSTQDYLANIYDSIEAIPIALYDEDLSETLTTDESNRTLSSSILSMTNNVKALDALLRGLATHEYKFASLNDVTSSQARSSKRKLAKEFIGRAWHHVHSMINSSLEIAHLDIQGIESCFEVLKNAIALTICLDMPTERAAFLQQLGRYRLFNAWRRGAIEEKSFGTDNIKMERWYQIIEEGSLRPFDHSGRMRALKTAYEVMNSIEHSLADEVEDRRVMRDVVSRIQDAGFLLNDPSRSFVRQGTLLKRSSRTGRSTLYEFFLFSDVLIYGKKIGTREDSQYKIHETLPLILMKVVDFFPPTMKKESKVAFQLFHPKKNILVLCRSKEDRGSWVNSIRSTIELELERKVAMEAARRAASSSVL